MPVDSGFRASPMPARLSACLAACPPLLGLAYFVRVLGEALQALFHLSLRAASPSPSLKIFSSTTTRSQVWQ